MKPTRRVDGAWVKPRRWTAPIAVCTLTLVIASTLAVTASAQTVGNRDMGCAGRSLLQGALVLAQAIADPGSPTARCDVNGDGRLDNRDVRAIQECDVNIRAWTRCVNVGVDVPVLRDKPDYYDEAIDFTKNLKTPINVTGDFTGHVAFIQATLVAPSGNEPLNRPDLVPNRAALMVFFPSDPNEHAIRAKIGAKFYDLVPPENQPHHDGVTGNEAIVYSKRAWTAVIDAEAMRPGMSIQFTNGDGDVGAIAANKFRFAAPLEFTAIAIRLGMLTGSPPSALNEEERSVELALDYFNKVPVAKYRLAAYEPIELDRVVLFDGTVYTGQSAVMGGWFAGDMRFHIAKLLIGSGIPRANLGIPSWKGNDENEPRPFRQTTMIKSKGAYTTEAGARAIISHCCSGGAGQVILNFLNGNEFSHEYGHDHGLGHSPGGDLSKHSFDGGWGYDVLHDRLIANVRWTEPATDGPLPWKFNTDPMSGGADYGSVASYTLHTPNSLRLIQRMQKSTGWHDPASPTGYSGWDLEAQKAAPIYQDRGLPVPEAYNQKVTTILGYYDPDGTRTSWIAPALYGNWGVTFRPQAINNASGYSNTCTLRVKGDGPDRVFNLADEILSKIGAMNAFHVNVPTKFKATRAVISCKGKQLTATNFDGPTGEVPDVIEVGGDAGMKAALRVPIPEWVPTTTREAFDRQVSLRFGVPREYQPGTKAVIGQLYSFDGSYYQARTATTSAPPGGEWRLVVKDVDSYVKDTTIGLGQKSRSYTHPETSIFYSVAVDDKDVLASDIAKRGKRLEPTEYGTVTVTGTNLEGKTVPIVLRVQLNDERIANAGLAEQDPSYFTATFDRADNRSVPPGTYDVDFEVQAGAWHIKDRVFDAFRVTDSVTIN